MKYYFCVISLLSAMTGYSQTNCEIYKDKSRKVACELYWKGIELDQGTKASQAMFIASLKSYPKFAPSLHEMSVPYLKQGDFSTWKRLIDAAVLADPSAYLGDRGWCLFKFLKDYKNAFIDLNNLYKLSNGQPGYTGDGDYDLRIIMALAQREMGNYQFSIKLFNECISENERKKKVGLFDYLNRGVTYLRVDNYEAALKDFQKEINRYEKLADSYYYLALTYKKLHKKKLALECFYKAKQLYTTTGYYHNDPYCEVPDQVYLEDIISEIQLLKYK